MEVVLCFSWATAYIFMGMEIYNDGQQDSSQCPWISIASAVGIADVDFVPQGVSECVISGTVVSSTKKSGYITFVTYPDMLLDKI